MKIKSAVFYPDPENPKTEVVVQVTSKKKETVTFNGPKRLPSELLGDVKDHYKVEQPPEPIDELVGVEL